MGSVPAVSRQGQTPSGLRPKINVADPNVKAWIWISVNPVSRISAAVFSGSWKDATDSERN